MRDIGFSTGALAKDDFRKGMRLQEHLGVNAIEISALRHQELAPVTDVIDDLVKQLENICHVSFHAPSSIPANKEQDVVDRIHEKVPETWSVVLHPDAITDFTLWRKLGSRLCIENMDQRKKAGRTFPELQEIFAQLPDARLCFDIGHSHQVDPTMTEAICLLINFRDRLALTHVSEVNHLSHHVPITYVAYRAFQYVKEFIAENCPLIIESVVEEKYIDSEFQKIGRCFSASEESVKTCS